MTTSRPTHQMPFTRIELCVLSLVDGHLSVLQGRRESEPAKGSWALPGGVLRIDMDTSLESAAHRVALERLGLDLPYLRQQCTVGGPHRDPRAPWAVSIVYRALVPMESMSPTAGKRLEALRWVKVEAAIADKKLAFDHQAIVGNAVSDLRKEVDRLELPFEYLPNVFTLGELQQFCEVILGREVDKSSFRRRLDDRQCVLPVDGEYRRGANRPAQLYRRR
jgi:8-oxo-dGTP diphosphatase